MPDLDELRSALQQPTQLDSSHGCGQQRPREEDFQQRTQRRRKGAVASDVDAFITEMPPSLQSAIQQHRSALQQSAPAIDQRQEQQSQTQLEQNTPVIIAGDQRGAQTVVSNARHSSVTMQLLHNGAQPPQSRPNQDTHVQGPLPMPAADDGDNADDHDGSDSPGGDQAVPGSAPVPDGPSGKRLESKCAICHDFMYPFGSKLCNNRMRYY